MSWSKEANIKGPKGDPGAPGTTLHGGLTDVHPDQHHAKYTDAEAAEKIDRDHLYVKVAGDEMTGPLRTVAGNYSDPALSIGPGRNGFYDAGAGGPGVTMGGEKVVSFTSEGTDSRILFGGNARNFLSVNKLSAMLSIYLGNVAGLQLSKAEFFCLPVYRSESGAASNVYVHDNGKLFRSTSARRYKSDIKGASELADLQLDPVTFHHDGDDKDYIGFIADDVAAQDERAGIFKDGEIEDYDLRAVVAILAAKVNRMENTNGAT